MLLPQNSSFCLCPSRNDPEGASRLPADGAGMRPRACRTGVLHVTCPQSSAPSSAPVIRPFVFAAGGRIGSGPHVPFCHTRAGRSFPASRYRPAEARPLCGARQSSAPESFLAAASAAAVWPRTSQTSLQAMLPASVRRPGQPDRRQIAADLRQICD